MISNSGLERGAEVSRDYARRRLWLPLQPPALIEARTLMPELPFVFFLIVVSFVWRGWVGIATRGMTCARDVPPGAVAQTRWIAVQREAQPPTEEQFRTALYDESLYPHGYFCGI